MTRGSAQAHVVRKQPQVSEVLENSAADATTVMSSLQIRLALINARELEPHANALQQ